jgi:hypothetical protein
LSKLKRAGIAMLAGALGFWLPMLGLGTLLLGYTDSRLVVKIGSPERAYYFSRVGWVILASLVGMVVGRWYGWRKARRHDRARMAHLVAIVGCVLFLLALAYLAVMLMALSMPGWKDTPQGDPAPESAAPRGTAHPGAIGTISSSARLHAQGCVSAPVASGGAPIPAARMAAGGMLPACAANCTVIFRREGR